MKLPFACSGGSRPSDRVLLRDCVREFASVRVMHASGIACFRDMLRAERVHVSVSRYRVRQIASVRVFGAPSTSNCIDSPVMDTLKTRTRAFSSCVPLLSEEATT